MSSPHFGPRDFFGIDTQNETVRGPQDWSRIHLEMPGIAEG